jgi:hypothetical protein
MNHDLRWRDFRTAEPPFATDRCGSITHIQGAVCRQEFGGSNPNGDEPIVAVISRSELVYADEPREWCFERADAGQAAR